MWTRLWRLASRLAAWLRTEDLDRDFQEELDAHLAMLTDDNIRRGLPADQARRAARLRLGGAASLQAQHREARGLPSLESILQDLRFAFRLFAKDRWFTAAAIAALALGIGANATGFTIINAVFLRGLPFEGSERLLVISWQDRSNRRAAISYPELEDWRTTSQSFEILAAYSEAPLNISDDRALPEQVTGARVTPELFPALRQPPLLGRSFTADDAQRGAAPVVILSHRLWQSRYFGDREAIGATLRVNGEPATVIGVMPPDVSFPDRTALWKPFVPSDRETAPGARVLHVFGRLADGASRGVAQAEFHTTAQRLITAHPDDTRDFTTLRLETFTERHIGGAARPMFMTVMGAVSFVLLIACANVANMLLARSAHRAREVALRTAMGATRARVVRQLLLEGGVLSVAGGSLGLIVAAWGVKLFAVAMQNSGLPYWVVFEFDAIIFAYVAGISLVTAMLFGLAPALQVSKANANLLLQEGGRSHAGSRRTQWFSSTMVVAELALATVLLTGAGVLIRSFITLYATDLGLPVDRLMTLGVQLPEAKYPTPGGRRAFFDQLEPRVAAIPGVEAVATTTGVPPDDGGERLLQIEGAAGDRAPVFVGTVTITPGFFDVLEVPLHRGRHFDDRDGAPGAETVIINERLAARFFAGEDPIGKRLRFTRRGARAGEPADRWRTVVGVVPLIKQGSEFDGYINAVVYVPYRQETPAAASLVLRSALPPASVMDAVRRAVQAMDPDQPVLSVQTVADRLAATRWWQRTWGGLFAILSGIALVLCAVGLYAVTAHAVTQRTQEIGVRIALGAQNRQVLWMILRSGLVRLAAGLTIGLIAGAGLARALSRGLMDVSTGHTLTVVAIVTLLSVVSIAACVLPVRRATRVDPVAALRAE